MDIGMVAQKIDVLVMGLGKTGMSCVRFLKQQGLSVAVTDTRVMPPCLQELKDEFKDVPFFSGDPNSELCKHAGQIVVSPGVSLQQGAIQAALAEAKPVYGDVELFCRHVHAPIVAITGTNGKSTVAMLVAKMAEEAGMQIGLGGNLGTPVLELLTAPTPQFYVLELSSFQLDSTVSLNAFASVVLNVSSDHMDRYGDIEHYARSKQKVYAGAGVMIINSDDPHVLAMLDQERKCLTFSINEDKRSDFSLVCEGEETWLCHGYEKIVAASELGINGKHNAANALAAMALGTVMQIPYPAMAHVLNSFCGLPHRCQFVANIHGIDWVNDSKATNVGASIAAIKGLAQPGRIILIAGGDSKDADLSALLEVLQQHVKQVYLLGIDADRFSGLIEGHVSYRCVKDMDEAVFLAYQVAKPGDTVLLAPACASLDMFENYQARGDAFMSAVHDMEKL